VKGNFLFLKGLCASEKLKQEDCCADCLDFVVIRGGGSWAILGENRKWLEATCGAPETLTAAGEMCRTKV